MYSTSVYCAVLADTISATHLHLQDSNSFHKSMSNALCAKLCFLQPLHTICHCLLKIMPCGVWFCQAYENVRKLMSVDDNSHALQNAKVFGDEKVMPSWSDQIKVWERERDKESLHLKTETFNFQQFVATC